MVAKTTSVKTVIKSEKKQIVCPPDDQSVLFSHPRVVLDLSKEAAACPYCNQLYQLEEK
jgi:uncharacterized Zn-finger protein